MEQSTVSRVEHKFTLSHAEAARLQARLSAALREDAHNHGGGYLVKSLYFDTVKNRDYFAKMDGLAQHRKLRLRLYDEDASFIRLESKRKYGERQVKDALTVTCEQAKRLCAGDAGFLLEMDSPLAAQFYADFARGYRPVAVVAYRRRAFYWPEGDLRVTLDSDIAGCETNPDLFCPSLACVPLAQGVVLEVKYSGPMPPFVRSVLGTGPGARVSFSKYGAGRRLLGR